MVLIANYVTQVNSAYVLQSDLRDMQGLYCKSTTATGFPPWAGLLGYGLPAAWAIRAVAALPPGLSAARPAWACSCAAGPRAGCAPAGQTSSSAVGLAGPHPPLGRIGGRWPFSFIKQVLISFGNKLVKSI